MWFCALNSFAVSLASTEAGRFCQFDSGSCVCHGSRIEVWVRQDEICAFLPTHGGCLFRSTVIYFGTFRKKLQTLSWILLGPNPASMKSEVLLLVLWLVLLAELLHDFWRPFACYIEHVIAILAGYTERFGLEPAKKVSTAAKPGPWQVRRTDLRTDG